MFAQVFQGRTSDPTGMWNRMEEWDRNLKPLQKGFLGSTAGVSDDGEFIAIARFESEEVARQNSDRPEQGEWWAGTEKLLQDVRFYDCTEVETFLDGGSDDAGFVQVIQGRTKQKDHLQEQQAQAQGWLKQNRPDLIGGVRAWQGNDFSMFAYFTSQEEARSGESGDTPEGGPADDWRTLVDDIKFIDLPKPYLFAP